MRIEYVWCDGNIELKFDTRAEAVACRESRGQGKVWRMEYDGMYLDRVTDVTDGDIN